MKDKKLREWLGLSKCLCIWDKLLQIPCTTDTRALYDIMRNELYNRDKNIKLLASKLESIEEYFSLVYKEEDTTLPKYIKKVK